MDDGATDGSLKTARAVRDPRVVVYSDGVNRGLSDRLNQIAQWARGEYLARMDADDLMHPHRLAEQIRRLDEDPSLDLVDTAVYSIDDANRVVGVRGLENPDLAPTTAVRHALLHHPAVTGRTQWFRRHPYNRSYWRDEDHELWCRTVASSHFGRVVKPLHFYREGHINLANYLASGRMYRRVVRYYGPARIGPWLSRLLILNSQFKSLAYYVCSLIGGRRWLAARRNRRLNSAEAREAAAVVHRVIHTAVPGLDGYLFSKKQAA
jgi:glycosyltransferase involved in cell wall biosynthesis